MIHNKGNIKITRKTKAKNGLEMLPTASHQTGSLEMFTPIRVFTG